MPKQQGRMPTRLVHAGEPEPRIEGAVNVPLFLSSTYEYRGEDPHEELRYGRYSNSPGHKALHAKLAALEGAEAALVAASGMAAITTALLTVLEPGDHLLAQRELYGGTYAFVTHELPRLGIHVDLVDADDPAGWAAALRPRTRAIYVETLSNPLVRIADLPAVVAFARQHGLVSMVDNTFATPINYRPAEHGFDLSLHSATKYLNGHSDVIAGAVLGRRALVEPVLARLKQYGGSLDAHAAYLLYRGLRTLAVRVAWQNVAAQRLAEALESHPAVERVHYPGLPTHPHHLRARTLLDGCGGVLAFEPRGGAAAADALLGRLQLPRIAPSLGGTETLVSLPRRTSHAGLSAAERARLGIGDGVVRVAVGLEAPEDLIEDFEHALAGSAGRRRG